MEAIKDKLSRANIKQNRYRVNILAYIISKKNHPTAEMIYRDMLLKFPYISMATIYNTLSLFVEKELIYSIKSEDNKLHYEGNLALHHHLICEKCGNIIDISSEVVDFEVKKGEVNHHLIKGVRVYLNGICSNCRSL